MFLSGEIIYVFNCFRLFIVIGCLRPDGVSAQSAAVQFQQELTSIANDILGVQQYQV
jgi:hypothetical protein